MNLQEFFNQHNGKYVNFDSMYLNQCVDLANLYNRDVVGNSKAVFGNGWQWYDNAPASYYTKVTDPKKGDIAVWKQSFGGYGHVAIVWDDGKFFSQNYPINAKCSLQSIPTNLISGYLRLKTMSDNTYDNHIIRTNEGKMAYVKAGTGKKQLITRENAGLGNIIFTMRLPKDKNQVFAQDWIKNVSDEKWNEYPEVPNGTWF